MLRKTGETRPCPHPHRHSAACVLEPCSLRTPRQVGHTGRLVLAICCCILGGLTGLSGAALALLTPPPDAQAAAVVLPPFAATQAMRLIETTGLPIADLRLGGRLVIVMLGPDRHALQSLRDAGLVIIAADAPPTCTWTAKEA